MHTSTITDCIIVVCVVVCCTQLSRGDLISAKILAITVVKGVIKAVTLTTEPSQLAPPATDTDTATTSTSKSKKSKKATKASTATTTAQQQQPRVSWTEALPHTKLPQQGSVYRLVTY
jgi:hypothetical protein